MLDGFGVTLDDFPELVRGVIDDETLIPFIICFNAAQPSLLTIGQQYVIEVRSQNAGVLYTLLEDEAVVDALMSFSS